MMESGWQNALLSNRYLIYIATISYALYVWHSPFRSGWFAEGSTMEVYMFRRPIGISMTFILAHLSTFYFEKPITNVARRLTSAGSPVRTRSGATGRGV